LVKRNSSAVESKVKIGYLILGVLLGVGSCWAGDSLGLYTKVLQSLAVREGIDSAERGEIIDLLLASYAEKMDFPFDENDKYRNLVMKTIRRAIESYKRVNKSIDEEELVSRVVLEIEDALDSESVFFEMKKKSDDTIKYVFFAAVVVIVIMYATKYYLDKDTALREALAKTEELAKKSELETKQVESEPGFWSGTLGSVIKKIGVAGIFGGVAGALFSVAGKFLGNGSKNSNPEMVETIVKKCQQSVLSSKNGQTGKQNVRVTK
jgi:hypothetical protein